MPRFLQRYLSITCVAGALLACALDVSAVRADAHSEARTRYERAIKLYEDGVYDAALVELTRAYELNPAFKVLYNIGQVRVAMQDYAGAVEAFQQYLREGGAKVPEARVESLRRELARLEQRVAQLTIQTDVSGAEVLLDDAPVGTTPLARHILVNSGMRRIAIRHPEHPQQTLRVSVAGGEQRTISLPLGARPSAATAQAPPSAPPLMSEPAAPSQGLETASAAPTDAERGTAVPGPEPAAQRRISPWTWSAWATTAALLGAGIGTAVAANSEDESLVHMREHRIEDRAEFVSTADKTRRLALAADLLFGASIVTAGVSVWLTLRDTTFRERRAATRSGTRTTTRVALHGRGVSLRTEF